MQTEQRQKALHNKAVFISCIVPVYNEEALVEPFFTQLAQSLTQLANRFEIIVVDDGSADKTAEKVLSLPPECHIKFLGLSRNFGKETALTAGLEHTSGDVTVILDADFQHPIEVIPTFLQFWAEGYEMVYGVRENRDNESSIKRNLAHLFYWLMTKITKIDRKVVTAINQFQERSRFMKGLYAWVGFKKIGVPFVVQDRPAGESSWGLGRLTELALTGITTFSDIPLRVWGLIGFIISLTSLIYAVYFLTKTLIFGADLPGFPSIIVAVMFLGGVQLLSIGILGEYIARIFTEVKQRPKYLIGQQHGFE
jgi:glycosyltransferase involved in cell wall biosynthesis